MGAENVSGRGVAAALLQQRAAAAAAHFQARPGEEGTDRGRGAMEGLDGKGCEEVKRAWEGDPAAAAAAEKRRRAGRAPPPRLAGRWARAAPFVFGGRSGWEGAGQGKV